MAASRARWSKSKRRSQRVSPFRPVVEPHTEARMDFSLAEELANFSENEVPIDYSTMEQNEINASLNCQSTRPRLLPSL